jgi:alkanesulfonate monooxygenase SsuD/methylene tetrahydromethanopterin reductase-like flavin-dependent oxidoreductase (luciferase family)
LTPVRASPPASQRADGVRREFEALGLPFGQRAAVFEEGLAVLRSLWTTGKVTHHGQYYDFDDVSFYSGTEMGPLMPVQQPPPTWVISNIRLTGELAPEVASAGCATPARA